MIPRNIRMKIGCIAFGVATGLFAAWGIGRLCALGMGIRDPRIVHENQIGMWRPDPLTGFANKRGFKGWCFGNVAVRTNEHGFRGLSPTETSKRPDVLRIIGVGDSVMWGTGVRQADSLLGILEELFVGNGRAVEVINAGVVGYSTFQEYLLLRDHLMRFQPDVVLLNFCVNDLLPTEDPAGNARAIYVPYLRELLGRPGGKLNGPEREVVRRLLKLLATEENVWRSIDWEKASELTQRTLFRVLIEFPLLEMDRLCRENGARLICLIIPTRDGAPGYRMLIEATRELLDGNDIETVDLCGALVQSAGQRFSSAKNRNPVWAAFRRVLRTSPFRDLDNIMTLRGIEYAHENYNFIDHWHPSRRGNRSIAEAVFERLSAGNEKSTGVLSRP